VSPAFAARYRDAHALLRQALPSSLLFGCSAGAVIGAGHEVEQRPAVSLTVGHLPGVVMTPFWLDRNALPDPDSRPGAWHEALGVPAEPVPQFLLLADPFSFPVDPLLTGMDYAYARSVKVGGLASGAQQPGINTLYLDDRIHHEGAIGLALTGDIAIDPVVAQGCRPIGALHSITRCDGPMLFELDGRTALSVLQDLAESVSQAERELLATSLFLGVVMDELITEPGPGDFLVRNIMGVDPRKEALAIGERLREGRRVQFHLRDKSTSAEDLRVVLQRYAQRPEARRAQGALLFSCMGRGAYLYGEADHDTNGFRDLVGPLPLGGFFCNGEIGPVGNNTYVHGYTSSFGILRPHESLSS
jgi:small ligand-binding sensory domain FIST